MACMKQCGASGWVSVPLVLIGWQWYRGFGTSLLLWRLLWLFTRPCKAVWLLRKNSLHIIPHFLASADGVILTGVAGSLPKSCFPVWSGKNFRPFTWSSSSCGYYSLFSSSTHNCSPFLLLIAKMSNKPIFLATHPRSCSTAFERVNFLFANYPTPKLI